MNSELPLTNLRIGVDIGGTFTDCVVIDGDGGMRTAAKSPSTPSDPAQGVMDVLAVAAESLGVPRPRLLEAAVLFVHGSTVATNALLERKGARTALLTSSGHEDTLLVGRMSQKIAGLPLSQLTDDRALRKADPPLVSRRDIVGVRERVDRDGAVVAPMDEMAVRETIGRLLADGVESIAVCLLWSPVNPGHERRIRQIVESIRPGAFVYLSSDVAPLIGEYERSATTSLAAYLGPKLNEYLDSLAPRLESEGLRSGLLLIQSTGGLTKPKGLKASPLHFLDSGPVAGVLGGQYFCAQLGEPNAILMDMGGTSLDVAVIQDGRVRVDDAPIAEKYTYLVPKVDVRSVASGGGSKIWIDAQGGLRVGPESAGAVPGPVCYDLGGVTPTITDCNLVLGFLDPDYFLGGRKQLNREAAVKALALAGERIGLDAYGLAAGAFRVINAQMADLIRSATVERGLDPRRFILMSYGGAGSTHAAYIAKDMGLTRVLIPRHASVFCALGMLATDLQHTSQMASPLSIPGTDSERDQVTWVLSELKSRVIQQFEADGVDASCVELEYVAYLKYTMQVHEIPVLFQDREMTPQAEERLVDLFEQEYERTHGAGTGYRAAGVQLTRCRVTGRSPVPRPRLRAEEPAHVVPLGEPPRRAARPIFAVDGDPKGPRFVDVPIFDGDSLGSGMTVQGPCIIERAQDTVLVPGFAHVTVDSAENFVMTIRT
jgi:N-methylhydantoinase A/oxoprolinase/acetone carboxylase beta subunit